MGVEGGKGEAVMGAVGWMGGQGRDGGEGCSGMQMGWAGGAKGCLVWLHTTTHTTLSWK